MIGALDVCLQRAEYEHRKNGKKIWRTVGEFESFPAVEEYLRNLPAEERWRYDWRVEDGSDAKEIAHVK